MYINMKKIVRYGVLMVIGMSMCFYGLMTLMIRDSEPVEITDDEVIERARELGMVPITEKLLENE